MFWRRLLFHLARYKALFSRSTFMAILLVLAIVFGVGVTTMFIFEHGKGSGLDDPGDIAWWMTATMTGIGSSSAFPKTLGGRIVGTGLMLFGIALIGTFTGAMVSMIIDSLMKEGQGMGTPGYKGHILICGWNPTAKLIVGELKAGQTRRPLVILADLERRPISDASVYFVRGDPASGDDLKRAGLMEASAAIVFPHGEDSSADSRSLLIALAIEAINPKVYTCVEVLDPRNKEHFQHAHVDEIVVATELGAHLLARAILYPGLSGIVSDLLAADGGNEFYKIPLDSGYVGKTFDQVLLDLRSRFKIILLAVERAGEMMLNPKEELVIQPGDQGLVVAWDEPKM